MDIENRQRKDISPYERGLSYARWLRSGYFKSQDDVARGLKVSSSQVSRLLKLARLPAVVVAAFKSPLEICESWGLDLAEMLDDPCRRESTLQRARAIGALASRPPAREVYRQLITAATRGTKLKSRAHDEVVKDARGTPLFRVRRQAKAVALLLPVETTCQATLTKIQSAVAAILQEIAPAASKPRGPDSLATPREALPSLRPLAFDAEARMR
jgi:ParB family chromosome partitioning protein